MESEQPTDADLVKIFRPLVAQAGSYEISGATLIMHPKVAKLPSRMTADRQYTFGFKLDGDTLTLTEGPASRRGITKLTRIGVTRFAPAVIAEVYTVPESGLL